MKQAQQNDKISRIECSVWSNGSSGLGLRVLGGQQVRREYFERSQSPILIEVNGKYLRFGVDKDSFWKDCGELINVQLKMWFEENGLKTGDHVWLEIIEPKKRFLLTQ